MPGRAPHAPRGSLSVGALVHVPTEPASAHTSQSPVHGVLQHTPSMQLPDWQSVAVPHGRLLGSLPVHEPKMQKLALAQSPSVRHELGQLRLMPLHAYGAHAGSPTAPASCGVQAPSEPGLLHVSHAFEQADWQQVPPAQMLDVHCELSEQVAPLACLVMHRPPAQNAPAAHWVDSVHVVGQAALAPSQANGAHAGAPG